MHDYLRRARSALVQFESAVVAFDRERVTLTPSPALPRKQIDKLADIAVRLRTAARRLEHSLTQVSGETALDVVDLQVRMEQEGAALASALKALGEVVANGEATGSITPGTLFGLEESAERVAAAIFPNAIEGVREINRTLWDFRPIWNEYGRILAREVAKTGSTRLTADQIARVEQTAAKVSERFDAVNDLLNQLVIGAADSSASVQTLVRNARTALSEAVRDAKSKAAEAYKPFHSVLKRAEALARKVDEQFAELRIPVFPAADRLDDLSVAVDSVRYAELAGVERFALLNITARLRSITLAAGPARHLLAPQFGIRIFDVFPDRVYLTANATFIAAVEALAQAGTFEVAPASLHRFKDGSFKQRQSRKGNLQLSYAFGSAEAPGDRTKVRVDADIDLYRSPVRHLFGEVLVNHLTGSKTDQFKVWDTLASNDVAPIGRFDVVTV
jgi:hypothetical protein